MMSIVANDQKPSLTLTAKPESCRQSCRLTFSLSPGDAKLSQVLISNNHQILADGTIDLAPEQEEVVYEYKPLSVDSPPETRAHLSVEVVDEKLYSQKIDVLLNIEGFPAAQPPPEPPTSLSLELLSAKPSLGGDFLEITFRPNSQNLRARFGGDCRSQAALYIADNQSQASFNIANFPTGNCQIYLTNTANERSNILEFEIKAR